MFNIFNNQKTFTDDQFPDIVEYLEAILKLENISNGIVNIIYITIEDMTELNSQYRKKSGPTDVISFPLQDDMEPGFLGEIYICPQVAADQAPDWDNTFSDEIKRLALHGLLHLLGYDHENESDALIMQQKESEYINLGGK